MKRTLHTISSIQPSLEHVDSCTFSGHPRRSSVFYSASGTRPTEKTLLCWLAVGDLGRSEHEPNGYLHGGDMKIFALGLLAAFTVVQPAFGDATAPQSDGADNLAQLKWLDSANPDKIVQADIKKGLFHFYV